jgi:twitching motility two-component system response regulator PilH
MTKPVSVLVVEDDIWTAEQHVRLLHAAGYRSTYATNTLEAIDAIDTRPPDAIILDVLLTGQNAFTLLHELRSHIDLGGIPVILCTNSADAIASEDVIAYGVRTVLDKTTMQPADLVAAVKKALL